MYLVLEYDLVDDYLQRRPEFREEHLALARAAHERGDLALAGALTEPADRALLVWSTEDRAVVEAFAAGDPALVAELLEVRKHAGMIVPAPVQAAMVAALGDDTHVAEQRARYGVRREVLARAFAAASAAWRSARRCSRSCRLVMTWDMERTP